MIQKSYPMTRRAVLHAGTGMAAATVMPRAAWALTERCSGNQGRENTRDTASLHARSLDVAARRTLAARAVDAAMAAGAQYADVRLTRAIRRVVDAGDFVRNDPTGSGTRQSYTADLPIEGQMVTIGVRARVNGYWGFASSNAWSADEAARLGNAAVQQARAAGRQAPVRTVTFGPPPPAVRNGHWETPLRIDPFAMPFDEQRDYLLTLNQMLAERGVPNSVSKSQAVLIRNEKTFASSEGMDVHQVLGSTEGSFIVTVQGTARNRLPDVTRLAAHLSENAAGWERMVDADVPSQMPRLLDEALRLQHVRWKPVAVGRYPVVFDAESMALLLAETLGPATQLARAYGHEANAGGTSFLTDPLGMLGAFRIGSDKLSFTGNRSMPGGLATVRWDDEGVTPEEFTLVKDGVLVDFQTTRESAAWIAPWYEKQGKPVRSHGCATGESALDVTMQYPPNLVMTPDRGNVTFDDLVRDTSRGYALVTEEFPGASVDMDFQGRSGVFRGVMREIVNGRLGAPVSNGAVLFDTLQLWKNLRAVGGAASAGDLVPRRLSQGQPVQDAPYSVRAVPGKFDNLAVIDPAHRV